MFFGAFVVDKNIYGSTICCAKIFTLYFSNIFKFY